MFKIQITAMPSPCMRSCTLNSLLEIIVPKPRLLHHPGLCREEVNIGLYGIIVCFFFSYKRMVLLFFSVRGEED